MGLAQLPSHVTLLSLTGGARSWLDAFAKAARVAAASEAAATFSGGGGPGGGEGGGCLPTGTHGYGATTAVDAPTPGILSTPKAGIGNIGVASAARSICGGGNGPLLLKWLPIGVAPLP